MDPPALSTQGQAAPITISDLPDLEDDSLHCKDRRRSACTVTVVPNAITPRVGEPDTLAASTHHSGTRRSSSREPDTTHAGSTGTQRHDSGTYSRSSSTSCPARSPPTSPMRMSNSVVPMITNRVSSIAYSQADLIPMVVAQKSFDSFEEEGDGFPAATGTVSEMGFDPEAQQVTHTSTASNRASEKNPERKEQEIQGRNDALLAIAREKEQEILFHKLHPKEQEIQVPQATSIAIREQEIQVPQSSPPSITKERDDRVPQDSSQAPVVVGDGQKHASPSSEQRDQSQMKYLVVGLIVVVLILVVVVVAVVIATSKTSGTTSSGSFGDDEPAPSITTDTAPPTPTSDSKDPFATLADPFASTSSSVTPEECYDKLVALDFHFDSFDR